jgi:hypothetical protein
MVSRSLVQESDETSSAYDSRMSSRRTLLAVVLDKRSEAER